LKREAILDFSTLSESLRENAGFLKKSRQHLENCIKKEKEKANS
jgi:hypothetical protein